MNPEELYTEIILDHFKRPRNYRVLSSPTLSADGGNPHCGDQVSFNLLIEDNIIKEIGFQSKGCAISKASSSILSEEICGKSIDEALSISSETILGLLGNIIDLRRKCALLPLFVVHQIIKGFKNHGTRVLTNLEI